MEDTSLRFEVVMTRQDADTIAGEVRSQGGGAEITDEPGLLPVGVLLAIVIPPGAAILAVVINRIIHSWVDHGTLIDARGTGAPRITEEPALDAGTVVILTRDGDKSERSNLSEDTASEYIGKALAALSGGASATEADQQAASAVEPKA